MSELAFGPRLSEIPIKMVKVRCRVLLLVYERLERLG